MKTLAELHETRLLDAIASSRKLLLTLLLFTLSIIGAGAVQINQKDDLAKKIKSLEQVFPNQWEPLESFYDRSGEILEKFADEHSTPWSQAYIVFSMYFIALNQLIPNPTAEGTIDRVSDLGKAIHRYNSDIRTIAAAQRRYKSFRELSSRELEAIERVVSHKFSDEQKKTLEDSSKFASVILNSSKRFQDDMKDRNDIFARTLKFEKPEYRKILERIAGGERWSDAEGDLLITDLYYSDASGDEDNVAKLRKEIETLPGHTIATVEKGLSDLKKQQKVLQDEAGLSVPLFGIRVSAAHITLVSGIINALFVGTLFYLLMRAGGEVDALKASAPDQPAGARMLMVRDVTLRRGELGRALFLMFVLVSPSLAALLLFGMDLSWSPVAVITVLIMLLIAVLAISAARYASGLAHSAESSKQ